MLASPEKLLLAHPCLLLISLAAGGPSQRLVVQQHRSVMPSEVDVYELLYELISSASPRVMCESELNYKLSFTAPECFNRVLS